MTRESLKKLIKLKAEEFDHDEELIELMLESMDKQKDGKIPMSSFVPALLSPEVFTNEQYLLSAFNYFDYDNNKVIDANDLKVRNTT